MHVYRGPRPATRKFASLELRGIAFDGSFSGYASVFGEVDLGRDVIERGAFRRSLDERGRPVGQEDETVDAAADRDGERGSSHGTNDETRDEQGP